MTLVSEHVEPDTRERILVVAERLFREIGYQKTTVADIAKVLRSAIANAQQKEGFGGDIDRLYVSACYANQGPSMKRIRPAPMGRAFRVVKRMAHLTVRVAERPLEIAAVPASTAPKGSRAKAKPAESSDVAKAPARTRRAAPKKTAPKRRKSSKSKK